ncbi:MAG: type II secretion system protein [Cyanobacteria bacterium SIG30]|nr:type II secretion system protein [Cyanobacteria bacterium SIG30]
MLITGGGATRSLKAFTLAEVLITLAIIGVVAALTIPSVVANHKRNEIETSLKSSYSILSNAFNLAIKDYGPTYTWSIEEKENQAQNAEAFFNKFFAPYLKIAKSCGTSTTSDCVYDFYSLGGGLFSFPAGNTSDHFSRFYLTNGMTITALVATMNGKIHQLQLYVDTNGWKKPNKMGIDVQYFIITLEKQDDPKRGYTLDSGTGDGTYAFMIQHTNFGCRKPLTATSGTLGLACTLLLKSNGWKIPSVDEYVEMAGGDESYRALYPWNF